MGRSRIPQEHRPARRAPCPSNTRRQVLALCMLRDASITLGSFWIALWLRFDGRIPAYYVRMMATFCPATVGILLLVGLVAGLYESLPTYTSLLELTRLGIVVVTVTFGVLLSNEAHNLVVG